MKKDHVHSLGDGKKRYLCTMISLARHIELLLLEHDCVIVPGVGGFIASYNPARYNGDGDGLFIPPFRTIAFNQDLTVNDGLLVQSYMAAYDASYPAACLQMEKEVEKMLSRLNLEGEYALSGVGTLRKTVNGNVSFESFESGVVTPSLYGLYSFGIQSLEKVKKEAELQEALQIATYTAVTANEPQLIEPIGAGEQPGNNDTPNGNARRRWIEVAVAAAAAVLLFATFIIPAMRTGSVAEELVVASACHAPSANMTNTAKETKAATAEKTKGNGATPAEAKPNTVADINNNKGIKGDAAQAKAGAGATKADTAEGTAKYALVMASYVTEANANCFIDQLKKEGYSEGRYVKKGKVSRVLYSGYATESEAYESLKFLRKLSDRFAEAWIIAL